MSRTIRSMGFYYMKQEVWRDIPGYEQYYQVSNYGNVRSLDRKVKQKGRHFRIERRRIIALCLDNRGYHRIRVSKYNVQETLKVHRLVASAFCLNPESKPEVNHKDGLKTNNYYKNLEWVTMAENMRHSSEIGLRDNMPRGNDHHNSKLNEFQVRVVKRTSVKDINNGMLAKCFGVHISAIERVRSGKTWSHVK